MSDKKQKVEMKTKLTFSHLRKIIFVLFFLFGTSSPVHAYDGNFLLKICKKPNPETYGICLGLLDGFLMGFAYGMEVTNNKKIKFWCEPEKMHMDQLVKVFLKFLNEHPEKLHFKYEDTLAAALMTYFPCKTQ
jgi:hypothetical protein